MVFVIRKNNLLVDINPLLIPMIAIMLVSGYLALFLQAFLSIMLHELGHILAASAMGKRTFILKVLPLGFTALFEEGSFTGKQRIAIYLTGPLVNLFICGAFNIINIMAPAAGNIIRQMIYINLCLAVFNLLPVYPLDGSKISLELLARYFGFRSGGRYVRRISFSFSAVIILLGVFLLFYGIHGLNLLLIGLYLFFCISIDYNREAAVMNMKEMLYRHTRFIKKGIYPVRDLVVLESMKLNSVLKSMDFDRFHIIYVLDNTFRIKKICTEKEIMDILAEKGGDLTFSELGT